MGEAQLKQVDVTVNGTSFTLSVEPRKTLADAIREDCGLTGTHLGCEHGVCGACTVLLEGEPVRSCLMFAVQCEGREVRTVESLAVDGELNDVQRAFWEKHGLQCGFCTPGFLMLVTHLQEIGSKPSDDELRSILGSNLCRCTGYASIVEATKSVLGLPTDEEVPA